VAHIEDFKRFPIRSTCNETEEMISSDYTVWSAS